MGVTLKTMKRTISILTTDKPTQKYIHDNAEFTRGDVFRHCGSWDEVRYVDVGSSKDPAVFSEERLPRFADFLTQIGSHERKAFVGAFSSETV